MKKVSLSPISLSTVALLAISALVMTGARSQSTEFRIIKMPGQSERITAIHCSTAKACVIGTDASGPSHIYSSDGQKITGTLVTGDNAFGEKVGTLGTIGFLGFSKVEDRLIAHLKGSASGFLSAKGDFTQASSWTTDLVGTASGENFGLNQQMGFGVKDGRWVHFMMSTVMESTDAPGKGALWTPAWSPVDPSFPRNFFELYQKDKSLCIVEPGAGAAPKLTQPAYVAPNLSVILHTSGFYTQRARDRSSGEAGVCISTNGGKTFHLIAFKGVRSDDGPAGVTCISSERCFAYSGIRETKFIYATSNASKGKDSSWAATKLPTLREASVINNIFFAPDGKHGWAVGSVASSSPLVFSSDDAGESWKDVSASARAVAPNARLHSGFAVDATHVWLGGEKDVLLTTGD
jgi:hypothetical protein